MMPRPITQADIARWKDLWSGQIVVKKCAKLGITVRMYKLFAYQAKTSDPYPIWVSKKTLEKRKKIGHPKPRKRRVKQFLREPDFSLEEMELAEKLMEG